MLRWIAVALALTTATVEAAPATWADVEPIPGADALLVSGESTHILAKIGGTWFITNEALGLFDRITVQRAFDASLLAKRPALAVIVESRDGGSGMGTAIDQLVILCADDKHLRKCGEIEIGHLEWRLDAEDRAKYPGGAFSLAKRPHVEVVLEPKLVAPDILRLSVKRQSTLALPSGAWEREVIASVDAVRQSAGDYRVVDDKLVRVR